MARRHTAKKEPDYGWPYFIDDENGIPQKNATTDPRKFEMRYEHGGFHRKPKTTQEIKANTDPDTGDLGRACRNDRNMPDWRCDLIPSRYRMKSWKDFRKGPQYRPK